MSLFLVSEKHANTISRLAAITSATGTAWVCFHIISQKLARYRSGRATTPALITGITIATPVAIGVFVFYPLRAALRCWEPATVIRHANDIIWQAHVDPVVSCGRPPQLCGIQEKVAYAALRSFNTPHYMVAALLSAESTIDVLSSAITMLQKSKRAEPSLQPQCDRMISTAAALIQDARVACDCLVRNTLYPQQLEEYRKPPTSFFARIFGRRTVLPRSSAEMPTLLVPLQAPSAQMSSSPLKNSGAGARKQVISQKQNETETLPTNRKLDFGEQNS